MLTAPPPNCATGTLLPYVPTPAHPWNRIRVQHLHRRLGFGASEPTIVASLANSPVLLVDQLIDEILATPHLAEPAWSEWTIGDYSDFGAQSAAQLVAYSNDWIAAMLTSSAKEKITLFWHNHFVTRFEDYFCPSWLFNYHQLLQTYGLGNFRDFVYEMGKTPAMLVFLNGVQNTRFQPNENYARELLELFTMGQDNGYTQQDIVEVARALTGWNGFSTACAPIPFVPLLHDTGNKTIFGQTGNWGYAELHAILFTHRAVEISEYICGKIYRHFVHPEIKEEIVAELAQTFRDSNWELAPVFRQLFKSEHFFDENIIGTQIKSPLDLMLGMAIENNLPVDEDGRNYILYAGYQLNQGLFNPPDVAGWRGNRDWVNSNSITGRWQTSDFFIFTMYQYAPQLLVTLAQNLTTDSANDPALVTQALVDFFVPRGLDTPEAYAAATAILKWEVPQNYYDSGQWNLFWETVPAQVALLLRYMSRLPEFQLS
ncbi:MAG: DUF1800 domain-containing protein [Bacteroidetes bacterium]|nr:MAG: DUF1800 domain-containing protein [Bacteroidota bacterium]PTM10911.1 MAG: DUF1800 domain-containing protein [Bacteroidota bacterium]